MMNKTMKLITGTVLASLFLAGKTYAVDACSQTQQLSGGRTIYNKNETGRGNGNYRYEIWRDGNGGELTLYPKDACFRASWNNAGDYLGRVGLVWDQYINYKNAGGDIIANYAYKKSGDDGGTYSYIGIYGWMDNPQIEYYVVDDWLHNRGAPGGSYMGSQRGTITVDGGTYKVWSGTRTGASKWGQSTFTQIFSVRTSQRQCGQINISEHFRQWEKLGLSIGSVMEAQILAESGGGSGYVDFTYATVEIGSGSSSGNGNGNGNGYGYQNPWEQEQQGQQGQSSGSVDSSEVCSQTQQLSGGRTIYNKNETGRGNGNYRYEIWRDGNGGELTLYPKDACFKASWNNAGDYLGRVGLVWDQYINYKNAGGDIIAKYAYKKSGDDGGTYSYIGIYGWMDNPQIEYYVVDDWLHNRGAPGGSYMGSQRGTITVDGGTYKVWSGTRTGASKWGQSTFTQIFSVRTSQRQCGQINISEHFRQWEKLGLSIGSVMEAQILAESGGGSGYVDFTYATVEIGSGSSSGNGNGNGNGYGYQNPWEQEQQGQQGQSSGSVDSSEVCSQTQQLSGGRTIYNKNETGRGNGNYRYEIWRDGNGGELTLYPKDACFKASWNNAGDYLGRVGLVWDQYINYKNAGGDIIAKYAYKKSGDDGGTYSYIGIYGWMDNPQIEYYVVDDWLHNRGAPGGSYMGSQKGTITVDGGTYKVWSGTRTGASKWGQSTFTQIFSVRTSQRQCGQINISEHFRQWEKLGLTIGSVMEAQLLAESGGGSGYVDFTYATVEIGSGSSSGNGSGNGNGGSCWSTRLGYPCCTNNSQVYFVDDNGSWGIQNDDWCGIVKTGNGNGNGNGGSCWSTRLGYPCCTNNSQVFFVDGDGQWGIQNGDWCGIQTSNQSSQNPSQGNQYPSQGNQYPSQGNQNSQQSSYPKGTGMQFYSQCKNPNQWAMTFDDGPTQYADAILDLLKERGVKATFFVLGRMYMSSTDYNWSRIVKRMYDEGHVVASHTYSHQDLTSISYQEIRNEMKQLEDAVYSAIGKKPAFMRPPYGSGNGNQNVIQALSDAGYHAAITWNIDSGDWDNKDINYAKNVFSSQAYGQGVISLNHLQYNGSTKDSIIALAKAEMDIMIGKGYKMVTMEECLGMSAYQ